MVNEGGKCLGGFNLNLFSPLTSFHLLYHYWTGWGFPTFFFKSGHKIQFEISRVITYRRVKHLHKKDLERLVHQPEKKMADDV